MTRPARPQATSQSVSTSVVPTLTEVIACLVTLLIVLRWLLPAEAATQGGQLGIAAVWCLLAGAWLWNSRSSRRAAGVVDLSVALLVGGHLAGGLVVFLTGGQLRTAANLMAEWIGLGCAWIVLREVVVLPDWSGEVRRALIATATTIALLGVWQHYVSLPQSAREYAPKIERLRAEQARGERSEIAWELARLGVPTTDPGLMLYEKRLRDSREPFGFFALANTLGGLLAACFVWGLATALAGSSLGDSRRILARLGPMLLMIAWCLALTKSRTAWAGAACGVVVVVWQAWRSRCGAESSVPVTPSDRDTSRRQMPKWVIAAAGIVLLAASIWGLVLSGAWDRQILTEASKSLGYRRQYWAATVRLITESPLVGIGLGQFREHYLRVKLPEASEEIADPHNLLLDAWVNGGACAAIGLLGLMGCVLASVWRSNPGFSEGPAVRSVSYHDREAWPSERPGLDSPNGSPAKFVVIGGIAAFVVAWASGWLWHNDWDDRYFVLGAVWCVLFVMLRPTVAAPVDGTATLTTLSVHLLGAGGLGMPAVIQTAWVWLAVATGSIAASAETANPVKLRRRFEAIGAIAAGLFIAIAIWRPVLNAGRHLERGDLAALRGDTRSAANEYVRANEADPWNPTGWGRSAELEFDRWQQLPPQDRHYSEAMSGPLAEAIAFLHAARQRDPRSIAWTRRMAEYWMELYERSSDRSDAARAAELLQEIVPRYETNASLLAQFSDAAAEAGSMATAIEAARRAVAQDDLNQRLGHVERVLPSATRQRLERRLESPGVSEGRDSR